MQTLSGAVERESEMLFGDMYIDENIGCFCCYGRTFIGMLHPIVGDRILHPIGNKTAVSERIAINGSIDGKGILDRHIPAPLHPFDGFV